MTKEQEAALLEYEELKISTKAAEARMDELKPILLEVVHEDAKINVANGFFQLKKRDNWKFNEGIIDQENELKELKASAIAKGEATNNPTYYVEYKGNK